MRTPSGWGSPKSSARRCSRFCWRSLVPRQTGAPTRICSWRTHWPAAAEARGWPGSSPGSGPGARGRGARRRWPRQNRTGRHRRRLSVRQRHLHCRGWPSSPTRRRHSKAKCAPGLHSANTPASIPRWANRAGGQGRKAQAEDGNPTPFGSHLKTDTTVQASGLVTMPVGDAMAGPATPCQAFEFTVMAKPGARLSFATMFGQSNDRFYTPSPNGIALFGADGKPVPAM
ncbi:MAG: spondin domain-containing protein [Candidatus Sericytochromatia bacterium]|nr:spondin domain-containing protein [Candidatus Sericytochromatia bacterium]